MTTDNRLRQIGVDYLQMYADKYLDGVGALFADDISLRDWKIHVRGKALALAETKKNFAAAKTIEIITLDMFTHERTLAAELKITVDGSEELFVVDVISVNEANKINSIRAYLGRADAP